MSLIELTNGTVEYVYYSGDPTLRPVVFLHEALGCAATWGPLPRLVCERTGRTVVAYSRHGHGGSPLIDDYRDASYMHRESRVLAEFTQKLSITSPTLVGHSEGASIAILGAAASSMTVTSLVLIAPHVFVESHTLSGISRATEQFETGKLRQTLMAFHEDPNGVFYRWRDTWLSKEFRAWDIRDFLPQIKCPVMLIQGLDDQYGTVAQLDEIERRITGGVQRIEPAGVGHTPHLERPDITVNAITTFLQAPDPKVLPQTLDRYEWGSK